VTGNMITLPYVTKRMILTGTTGALFCLAAFSIELLFSDWWGIIDPNLEVDGRFKVPETLSMYGLACAYILATSTLVLIAHDALVTAASKKLSLRKIYDTGAIFSVIFAILTYTLSDIFRQNQIFRYPPSNIGTLYPPRVYIFLLIASYFLLVIIGAVSIVANIVLEKRRKNG
jgi:multisubunit Na+/H+ antiporter MnhE subunit